MLCEIVLNYTKAMGNFTIFYYNNEVEFLGRRCVWERFFEEFAWKRQGNAVLSERKFLKRAKREKNYEKRAK